MIENIDTAQTPSQRFGIEGFEPFRDRGLDGVLYVRVYRNLVEQKKTGRTRWSIFDRSTSVVVGHADRLAIYGAVSHVNAAAQQRIASGGPREVHAWVWGALHQCPLDREGLRQVTYHPHENPQFRWADTGQWFHRSPVVLFDADGMWATPLPAASTRGSFSHRSSFSHRRHWS